LLKAFDPGKTMSKLLKPIHPGEQLREEFMIPLGLSSNALARALNVTPTRVNEIVRERRGISADTALRLAQFFNTSHLFWLNLQSKYDVQCAQDLAGTAIAHIKPFSPNASHSATSARNH
jgi:antitoxin HigA-1